MNIRLILSKKLIQTRNLYQQAQQAESEILGYIESIAQQNNVDLEGIPYVDGGNLLSACTCYLNYGQGNIIDIIENILEAINKKGNTGDNNENT